VINRKKREREARERGYKPEEVVVELQKKSLLNSGTSLFVPQRNFRIKGKRINTPPSTVHLRWMTLKRFRREKEIS
jgi:hypothetical protein